MNKPSDMPHRRLEVARTATDANYAALTAFADQAIYLIQHFTEHGHDLETAVALTEITLDRFDDERNI
ncbi:hypothetical protein J8244_09540 [Corynebacterium tuberculostearicum]|jgi:hypothetical protein|uniref:hypothetical protein n=1 Tax=Corynebacterium tuberculostearicum TaxID=38304 RepID=UPI002666E213|nr:hypothetical protein [Corynebacterium tuberculostearicum]WKE50362.1 hypothetical protein J8244_09540 [Corynebacterium tuberculostearicum]